MQDRRVGFARAPLPEAGALAGQGEQFLAIRAETDGDDGLAVMERGQREAARGDLPDAGHLIASAGNDGAAIRAEAGLKDGVVVPEHLERPSIPGVPKAHRFVGARAQDHVVVGTEGDGIDRAIVLLGKKVVGGEVFPAVPPHHGFARENVPDFHRGGSFVRVPRSRDEPEIVGGKSRAIHGLLVEHVAVAQDRAGPGVPDFHLPAGAGPSVRLRALDGSAGGDIIAVRAEPDLADFARPFDRPGEGKPVRNPAHLDQGTVLRFLAIDEGHAIARGAQGRRDHGAAQFAEVADGPAIAFPDGGLALSVVVAGHREEAASGAVSGLDHMAAGERKLGEAPAVRRRPQPHHTALVAPGVGKRQDRLAILRIESRPGAALLLIFFQKRQAQARQLRHRGPDPDPVGFIAHQGSAILAVRVVQPGESAGNIALAHQVGGIGEDELVIDIPQALRLQIRQLLGGLGPEKKAADDESEDDAGRADRRGEDGAAHASRPPFIRQARGDELLFQRCEVAVLRGVREFRAAPEQRAVARGIVPLRGGGAEAQALADGHALFVEVRGGGRCAERRPRRVEAVLGEPGLRRRAPSAQQHRDPVINDRLRGGARLVVAEHAPGGLRLDDEIADAIEKIRGQRGLTLPPDEPGVRGLERGEIVEAEVVGGQRRGGFVHDVLRIWSSSAPTLRNSSQRLLRAKSTL